MKVTDADVGKYLRLFTFLSIEKIESILRDHARNPELRIAQHCLASEITEMVHESEFHNFGKHCCSYTLETGVVRADTMTNLVFGSNYSKLKAKDVLSSFENDPRLIKLAMHEFFETPVIKLAARYGLVSSNCQSLAFLIANTSFCLRLFAKPLRGILYPRGACI